MTEDAIWQRLAALKGDPTIQLAPRTQRVYNTLWGIFARWCDEHGYEALPATPATVAHHLMDRHADGKSASLLKTTRNAISSKHRLAGLESPTKDPRVKETLSTLSLHHARTAPASRQAVPVRAEHLKALAEKHSNDELLDGSLTMAEWRRYAQDKALVFVMYSALLRGAEAAELRWGDIRPQEDGKALVTIRRSKTSLTPETVAITSQAMGYLQALAVMSAPGGTIEPGGKVRPDARDKRVFGVKTSSAIRKRVIRAMQGIREGVSGHSCRVGAAQDLTLQGVPLQAVQKMGRWKSLQMPSHYASKVDPQRGAIVTLEELLG